MALKVLRGNPGRRRVPQEPTPPPGGFYKPKTLSRGAARVWGRLAPIAIGMGTLTAADVAAFATLCELQATLEAVTAAKGAPGFAVLTVAADATGAPTVLVHPIVKVERETALALRAYYAAFGLEPSARSRLHVAQAAPPEKATKWPALV